MDNTCFEILEELERQYPKLVSFDLTNTQTADTLKALSGERYIRLYMDGDADITDAGRQALKAERSRREREAAKCESTPTPAGIPLASRFALRLVIGLLGGLCGLVLIKILAA